MSQEEKKTYMSIATRVCGINFRPEHIDLLVELYDQILKDEGKTDIMQICKIEHEVIERNKQTEPLTPPTP